MINLIQVLLWLANLWTVDPRKSDGRKIGSTRKYLKESTQKYWKVLIYFIYQKGRHVILSQMSPPVFLSLDGSVHCINSPRTGTDVAKAVAAALHHAVATKIGHSAHLRRLYAPVLPARVIVLSRSPLSPLSPSSPPPADHRRGPWRHLPVSAGLSNDHGVTSPSPLDLHDFGCRIIAIVSGGIGLVVASLFTWARLE
jgi:hypothetical protein